MPDAAIPYGWDNPAAFSKELGSKPEQFWIRRGERRALKLFHSMAVRVPAYRDFLKKHKFKPEAVKSFADFQFIPTVDKENYLKAYPRASLCWDGDFDRRWIIATTSGSTGEPFYFPREEAQDTQYALMAEMYLRANFQIHKKSTLYIVGFPMGAWIGGLFTYEALQRLAARGKYNLSVITPGINKAEIIKAVKNLGSEFDQVIIGSYGPFLKDTLDDGIRQGLDWKKYNMGFVFSAEAFSEDFRNYVINIAGLKNEYTGTLNHYGTVDLGTMSYETPVSVLVRRMAVADESIYEQVFSQIYKLPTLTQYVPEHFFFEESNGSLLCSGYSGYPLVRYDLKDHGGVFTLNELTQKLAEKGVDLPQAVRKAGLSNTMWNLPFVHVYERSDLSVSFYAFQIYPETVRKALHNPELHKLVTGKFTMQVLYDKKGNQYFEVHAELKSGVAPSAALTKRVATLVTERLLIESSEYAWTYQQYPKQAKPKITFWPYEHPTHFMPGVKQKWVKK